MNTVFYLIVMFAHGEAIMPNYYYDPETCNAAALQVLADNPKRLYNAYCIQFEPSGSYAKGDTNRQ
jgi:hypothetical protein